jgi:hypothetical protein
MSDNAEKNTPSDDTNDDDLKDLLDDEAETGNSETDEDADDTADLTDEEDGNHEDQSEEEDDTGGDGQDTRTVTQEKLERILLKRAKKLTGKVEASTKRADRATEDLEAAREQIKILRLAVEKNQSAPDPTEPDPEDFDLGHEDPEYRKALRTFNAFETRKTVEKSLEAQEKQRQQEAIAARNAAKLEENAEAHYRRAAKLNVKDYGKAEDVAIAAIGQSMTNIIINEFEESEHLLYHLGKNPDLAEELVEIAQSNPVKVIRRIDKIITDIKKPAKKTTNSPDPDEPLEGGRPGAAEAVQKKYERLVTKAQDSSNPDAMNELRNFKRKCRKKGINPYLKEKVNG